MSRETERGVAAANATESVRGEVVLVVAVRCPAPTVSQRAKVIVSAMQDIGLEPSGNAELLAIDLERGTANDWHKIARLYGADAARRLTGGDVVSGG